MRSLRYYACALVLCLIASSCVKRTGDDTLKDTTTVVTRTTTTSGGSNTAENYNYPVTLPVVDAFMTDSSFIREAKQSVGLSDSEIAKVRTIARTETAKLTSSETSSTMEARVLAEQRLSEAIGREKASRLILLMQQRWAGTTPTDSTSTGTTAAQPKPNTIPQDARIVVNAPEFRMDVFDSGKLIKSYKVAVGYPEFPLPTGLRHAEKIIFNPSWTTPDEPWVESSNKVKVGEKVMPGDKNNPLGIMKIPIGLPSLIHGGKNAGQLGTFGSHGCVGLTNDQAKDFLKVLARITGDSITDKNIADNTKAKDQSKDVKLGHSVPVELRYETMVVEDGKLHIFRDIYDHNTNTDSMLSLVLSTYGVTMNDLTPAEQAQVKTAMQQMSRDAKGNPSTGAGTADSSTRGTTASADSTKVSSKSTASTKKGAVASKPQVALTKTVTGAKEVVIPIAALAGKGYPAMAANTPTGSKKTKK